MKSTESPEGLILASIAVGFVSEPKQVQPTHYQLVAIGGPLRVRWPDGRWFEITVKEINEKKKEEEIKTMRPVV